MVIVGSLVGVDEGFLARMQSRVGKAAVPSAWADMDRVARRFYAAMVLARLVQARAPGCLTRELSLTLCAQETPAKELAERYGVDGQMTWQLQARALARWRRQGAG